MGITVTSGVVLGSGLTFSSPGAPPPTAYRLLGWGQNTWGPIGDSSTISRSSPVLIGATHNWAEVATVNESTAAIRTDGTLWTWGGSGTGQLGVNNTTTVRSSPVQVGALTNWSKVAAAKSAYIATKTDGTLWSWGGNDVGQLGRNNTANASSPVQIGADTDWSAVYGGLNGTVVAQKTSGVLYVWGWNSNGQLGLQDRVNRSSPTQLGSITSWTRVSVGSGRVMAIRSDGTLWGWGGTTQQLGLNSSGSYRSSPVQIGTDTNWSRIACGDSATFAVRTTGTLWAWGTGAALGYLGTNDTTNRSSPVQLGAATNWTDVFAGPGTGWAIRSPGSLWSWGLSSQGQMGSGIGGAATYRSSPVQVGSLTTWISVYQGVNAGSIAARQSV